PPGVVWALSPMGVRMSEMLTGVLPYDTPAPSDIDRLRRGDLIRPPRSRNAPLPTAIDEIEMHALSGEVNARYQRAEDLLNDMLRARRELVRPKPPAAA